MTTILIVLFLIAVFAWFFLSSKSINSNKREFNNHIYEDHNYQALKKLFFAVNANDIHLAYLNNSKSVYGVLIEAYLKDNRKILFACYISGFAGYYQNKEGGVVGGKRFPENDRNVQQELMQLCKSKNLNGEGQKIESRRMATKMTLSANEFLSRSVRQNSWQENTNTIKFWFLTKEGVYFAEEQNSLLKDSIWYELVKKGYQVIRALN